MNECLEVVFTTILYIVGISFCLFLAYRLVKHLDEPEEKSSFESLKDKFQLTKDECDFANNDNYRLRDQNQYLEDENQILRLRISEYQKELLKHDSKEIQLRQAQKDNNMLKDEFYDCLMYEKSRIEHALKMKGTKAEAAELLGIDMVKFCKKLKKYGIY